MTTEKAACERLELQITGRLSAGGDLAELEEGEPLEPNNLGNTTWCSLKGLFLLAERAREEAGKTEKSPGS